MYSQNPIVGTYRAGVRVGNWFEDIALEEDNLKDYLDRRERGSLLCQKKTLISEFLDHKVELSVSRDGNVHFGDVVMVINPAPADCSRCLYTLCLTLAEDTIMNVEERICADTKDVVGARGAFKPNIRCGFVIRSCDGSHDGEILRYYQPFYLCTADGKQFLNSDMRTFTRHAKKSRHNKVWLSTECSRLSEWRIIPVYKKFRMELEQTPVPANAKILFNHARTNQCLCLEVEHFLSTYFGRENEISGFTWLEHGAEFDQNHWMLIVHVPGSDVLSVPPPAEGMPECPQICQKPCVSSPDEETETVPVKDDQKAGH